MLDAKKVVARPLPDGSRRWQVSWEQGMSRRTLNVPPKYPEAEPPPHGAGSFHDPEHHQQLMDRVESLYCERSG